MTPGLYPQLFCGSAKKTKRIKTDAFDIVLTLSNIKTSKFSVFSVDFMSSSGRKVEEN